VVDAPAVDVVSPEDRPAPMDTAAVVDAGPADVPLVCDADTRSDPVHCGRCGNACPVRANAGVDCAVGVCGIICRPGFANCDGATENGCEVDTNTSAANCGACGRGCAGGQVCEFGRCKAPCAGGLTRCRASATNDGVCVDLDTDRENCGACRMNCGTADLPRCRGGVCVSG